MQTHLFTISNQLQLKSVYSAVQCVAAVYSVDIQPVDNKHLGHHAPRLQEMLLLPPCSLLLLMTHCQASQDNNIDIAPTLPLMLDFQPPYLN